MPLSPLVPGREIPVVSDTSTERAGGRQQESTQQVQGEMTRVDMSLVEANVVKIKQLLPQDHTFSNFSVRSDSVMKQLSANQKKDVLDMLAKASYIKVKDTEFSETALVAKVKKYGKATLAEQVEGRLEHTVTIQQKVATRSMKRMSDIRKFSYQCTCDARKAMCKHIATLLLSEFLHDDDV